MDDDPQVRLSGRDQLLGSKPQRAGNRVVENSHPFRESTHVVAWPPCGELRAPRGQPCNQVEHGGVVANRGDVGAKLRQHPASLSLPVPDQLPSIGLDEDDPHQIAIGWQQPSKCRIQQLLRPDRRSTGITQS